MADNLIKESDPPQDKSPSHDEKKKNRRGRGSKSKQAEAFRSKKNKSFESDLVKKIENMKISFDYAPRDLFGERLISPVLKPQIEFPLNTEVVANLCHQVVEVLHGACKIPPSTDIDTEFILYDIETLMWATALQIECKIYNARAGTQFVPNLNEDTGFRVKRTELMFKNILTPFAVIIDQIGRFTVNEQLFVPNVNNDSDFVYSRLYDVNNTCRTHFPCFVNFDQPGVRFPFPSHDGRLMRAVANPLYAARLLELGIINQENDFTDAFLAAPQNYPYYGLVDFVAERAPPNPLPFSDILRRYVEFEGRVSKKLANAFVEIDLSSGKGVESQIVFRRHTGNNIYQAWSPRAVRADALELGAILGLGFPCTLGTECCAAVFTTVDTSAGCEVLANILTKKLR